MYKCPCCDNVGFAISNHMNEYLKMHCLYCEWECPATIFSGLIYYCRMEEGTISNKKIKETKTILGEPLKLPPQTIPCMSCKKEYKDFQRSQYCGDCRCDI